VEAAGKDVSWRPILTARQMQKGAREIHPLRLFALIIVEA
jgi:hypothetical protein